MYIIKLTLLWYWSVSLFWSLIQGLKKNWDKLQHEYQGLSIVTDTLSKRAHKEQLEEAMKQLEKDINLFERFKTIYVPTK